MHRLALPLILLLAATQDAEAGMRPCGGDRSAMSEAEIHGTIAAVIEGLR